MIKKHQMLLAAIIVTASGIMFVLGIWLYSSYRGHKQIFLAYAERELFEVTQDFYLENQEDFEKENQHQRTGKLARMAADIQIKYPNTNRDTIQQILTEQYFSRTNAADSTAPSEPKSSRGNRSRHFIMSYAFRTISWTEQVIDSLDKRLTTAMSQKKRFSPFTLRLVEIEEKSEGSRDFYAQRFKESKTRPILVDPTDRVFLELEFSNPRPFLVKSIGWQLFFSFILTAALWGTFLTLMKTIRKQRQLAQLRKAFVNNMTHELKTPVSTVMAAIESIQRYGAQEDREKMNRYLNLSRQELEHLSRMIEKVLQVDVAETNGVHLNPVRFDFGQVVAECADNFRLTSKKNIEITLDREGDSFGLVGDPSHLKSVINNLLDNAIKYSNAPVFIQLQLQESEKEISLKVSDNGIGIPQSYLQDVFDLFFRVPSGNVHNVKGFGLGLAYVKQIIHEHQGQIHVTSKEGNGSVFVVTLPKQ